MVISRKDMAAVNKNPNPTGNRPAPDRSPQASGEGKRQETAKAEQQQALKDAPKSSKSGKVEIDEDPRRYYQGSEMQKKIEETNLKISQSNDLNEKNKLREDLVKTTTKSQVEKEKAEEAERQQAVGGKQGQGQSK